MKFLILAVAIVGAVSAGAGDRDKRGLISPLGYGWDNSLALHASSWSQPLATSFVAAPTVVNTISHAPIINRVVAPHPIVNTVVSTPHVFRYPSAPIVHYGPSFSSLPLSDSWAGHYPFSDYPC